MLRSEAMVAFVPSTDLDRSRSFYVDVLGLDLSESNDFALVLTAGGTMLRVTRVEDLQPQPFTVLGWVVPDIAAAVSALAGRQVMFTRYDGMEQDDQGVWTAPGGAKV